LSAYLDHVVNIALGASEFCRVFDFDKDDKVEIMPHVVLLFAVLLK